MLVLHSVKRQPSISSKSLVKGNKIYWRRKKEKSENMVLNDIKIYQSLKNKGLIIEKRYYEKRKNKKTNVL